MKQDARQAYEFGGPIGALCIIIFLCMISHSYTRDMERCAQKYGDDWDLY